MMFWQKTALTVALMGATGLGAAMAPTDDGQSRVRAAAPRDVQVFSFSGGRLGVSISDLEGDQAKGTQGVRIDEVEEGSPAEKSGFQKGDVVTEFDGERVRSARQFSRLVTETPAGRTVTASVMRNGQRVTLNVTPRESSAYSVFRGDSRRAVEALENMRVMPTPVPPRVPRAPRPPRPPRAPEPPAIERFFYSGTSLGVTTNSLSEQLREYFGTKGGVLVTSVLDDSPASRAGVKAGDVIVSLNARAIDDPFELRSQMQRIDPGAEFTIEVVRERKTLTLKGKTEERSGTRWTTRTIL